MAKQVNAPVSPWRFRVVIAGLLILAALLLARALTLQVLDVDRGYRFLQGQGNARTIRTEIIPAHRGMISDRNGEPLAVSTPVASIWANPQELGKNKDSWAKLARALNMSHGELAGRLQRYADSQFMYLRRHLSPQDAKTILALKVPGVYLQREYRRFYPAGEVAAHMLGFTDIDDRGQEGLELAYDEWLNGTPGSKRVLKDLYGNIIREIDAGREASPGKDLQLSIDLRLQYLAYKELKSALKRTGAKAGSVVILDSRSGEVLALVNQPSYNPNNRSQLSPSAMRNRALTDMFEPGSTMKPLTMVAALESGRYQPDTEINTHPGYIKVGPKLLEDHRNYGVLTVADILKKSSQVGTTKIALSLDEQEVWRVFQRFGLGRSTGSGFPGESTGVLPNHPNWRAIERATFAFGYGLTVTSLQLAQAYSVFANHGVFQPVSLVKREASAERKQLISPIIARQIVDMLESVTGPGGTATRARVDAYRVAGKTGTSHKAIAGGYAEDRYFSLFAGVAPASDPRIVAVVAIDEPKGDYFGGLVAAPVFSKVVADALRLMNIAPDDVEPVAKADKKGDAAA
ncbi:MULTISPECIES: peptidoglycan D,D-transpeptidase FtsI family protein [Spongiibacter]|uniref:peptidoglycan D,D-transpeptidase FtsI family protein n=1 Tax=Spongiibacter TaxID=630749 RepID=UPI000C69005D|nr:MULTISPECIES: penicillin-binding transpeptidase domain-containing protein [Spongiibacter]MAY38450.1 cell division protein [Spongiibacter sp.]MBI59136.1 cell division protein [Spongiibacter sp.]|tara:strand:+ start:6365 stop:8086 length:1722 start_codon:yes stop_codon:yes gene_type:complete